MKFEETALAGVVLISPSTSSDARGSFSRAWCSRELAEAGLSTTIAQINLSANRLKGTLRGMHFQVAPHEEVKIVRCTNGAIFDVVIDLRPASPTYLQWTGHELSRANGQMLYIPKGLAHGFQTLVDDSDVQYQMGEFYAPGFGRGVRWNDPAFGITWPLPPVALSANDQSYTDFVP
jgi:dTDP-4-dehydrorhamnose 3,5-epimerase